MAMLRQWIVRAVGLFQKHAREQDLTEEIESNLQLHIADALHAGMPRKQARREALIRLGGIEQTKEAWRDQSRETLIKFSAFHKHSG